MKLRPITALVLATLVASTQSWAKISTSATLCLNLREPSISPHVTAELARLLEQSKGLGPVVALFVVTAAEPEFESEASSTARAQELVAYLAARGFKSEFSDIRRVPAHAADFGCTSTPIAVEIEALFPHDGYR